MLQPIGERVILEPVEQETKTEGGIYIPESAKEEKKEGTVIAAGQYKNGKDLPLQKGDKVIYGGYSNEEVEYDGKEYVIVEFKDIMAKVQ